MPSLITQYERAVLQNGRIDFQAFGLVVAELRKAASLRNVLCHASWKRPDAEGCSIPFFLKPNGKMFRGVVDVAFLEQTQRATADIVRAVIETVETMGWQFLGVRSPGQPII